MTDDVVIPERLVTTVLTACLHGAITWADPTGLVEALNLLAPNPPMPWEESVQKARQSLEVVRLDVSQ
jgi:hypothetical protein